MPSGSKSVVCTAALLLWHDRQMAMQASDPICISDGEEDEPELVPARDGHQTTAGPALQRKRPTKFQVAGCATGWGQASMQHCRCQHMQLVHFTCPVCKCVFASWYCRNRRHVMLAPHCTTVECSEADLPVFQGMQCSYPVDTKLDVVELKEHDLGHLDDAGMLNDSVIDFYAK